jgi:molybdenum cofactor biosynthesis protein B
VGSVKRRAKAPERASGEGAARRPTAPERAGGARGARGAAPVQRKGPIARTGEHRPDARGPRPIVCAVITVSDTRRGKADKGGALVASMIEQAGHRVLSRAWVKDEPAEIRRAAAAALALREVDCVILTGGTGLSPRDNTPDALATLIEKPLPGFGELFRVFSFEQVGPAAWFSRASAGVAKGRLVVTLPGSTAAVELALRQLLLPELVHAMRGLGRIPIEE